MQNIFRTENCVEMHGFGDLDWNDHRCEMKRSFICQYYLDGDPVPVPDFPPTGGTVF